MSDETPRAYVIDDDDAVRDAMSMLLDIADVPHTCFDSAYAFLEAWTGNQRGCLILDIRMPGMGGLELQQLLNDSDCCLPVIFMTGHGDIPMAVEAMRRGALDFLRKPLVESELLARIEDAFARESAAHLRISKREYLRTKLATLTEREREIFECVASGAANKAIAADLGISERTVEVHRAQVMKKLDAKTLADVVRAQLENQAP